MKTLLIDDIRTLPADLIARGYNEGARLLKEHHGEIGVLLLDHDLASWDENGREMTGYDIVKQYWEFLPDIVEIVSANPIGVDNIGYFLEDLGYTSDHTRRRWNR